MSFKDYFSNHAADYARYRPHYPVALVEYLVSLVPSRDSAWDCATGNGQVALGLANHFQQVVATDASQQQLDQAFLHDRIRNHRATAEQSGLPNQSIDLITVGQALHWFNLDGFYAEAKRVLKPKGVLAVWCYAMLSIPGANESVQAVLQTFYDRIEPHWPPGRELVDAGYRTIPFPFAEVTPPPLAMTADWTVAELFGYLSSWSATQRWLAEVGPNPFQQFGEELATAWGQADDRHTIHWPLSLRVGTHKD